MERPRFAWAGIYLEGEMVDAKRKVPPLRKVIRFADDLSPVGMTGLTGT
jgi:hypothetical protein